uniref:Spondin domain-containing protein n=1 Tax=Macrostomum lignano TaxID=282301 RepID=A0A1I8GWJ3_9PLAT
QSMTPAGGGGGSSGGGGGGGGGSSEDRPAYFRSVHFHNSWHPGRKRSEARFGNVAEHLLEMKLIEMAEERHPQSWNWITDSN